MSSGRQRAGSILLVAAIIASCSRPSSDLPRAGSDAKPGEVSPKRPRGREDGPPAPPDLPGLAQSYVRVALRLAQHDPELVDDWRGPEEWRPGPRQPVAPLLAEIEALQRELARQPLDPRSGDRVTYLTAQANALHLAAIRLLGRGAPFNDEARAALGIVPASIDPSVVAATGGALDRELPGNGPLVDRYAAFKQRLAIPPARVEAVMRAALDVCRTATLGQIALPPDERVELALVTESRWDGYARYLGGHRTRVEINRDVALDVTRALRLACHEGYPGHHVQHLWIDDELVGGRQWREFQLAPAFGRHLLIAEGAAEAGVEVLFPERARTLVYRDTLLPAAGQPPSEAARIVRIESLVTALEPVISAIVAAYLDSELTRAAAIERLRDETLTLNPEAMLAFAERRRTRVLVYPEGRALVHRLIDGRGLEGIRRMFVDRPFAVQ
jgi:hypothetical protein